MVRNRKSAIPRQGSQTQKTQAGSQDPGWLRVPLRADLAKTAGEQPATFGFPIARGLLFDPVQGQLLPPDSESGWSVQLNPLTTWSDGSIRWLLADTFLPAGCPEDLILMVRSSATAAGTTPIRRLEVKTDRIRYHVSTGVTNFTVDENSLPSVVQGPTADSTSFLQTRIRFTDRQGTDHQFRIDNWQIEKQGSQQLRLRGTGRPTQTRAPLELTLRLTFFSGTSLLKIDTSVHNPRAAKHPGGIWDLGDPGSVLFQDLSLILELNSSAQEICWQLDSDRPSELVRDGSQAWVLYQDSSGGEHWDSQAHVRSDGRVACRFQGYQLQSGKQKDTGLRASPTLNVRFDDRRLALAVPEFWQQFPKALSIRDQQITIGLFPRQQTGLFELQGGEQKTHTVWLAVSAAASDRDSDPATLLESDLSWVHRPALLQPTAEWCQESGLLPPITGLDPDATQRLDSYLTTASQLLLANRERVDEYGWRHYGDIFADHEQQYYDGPEPLISHYNNQFDMVLGFLLHYLRTGSRQWFDLADALARHVTDIDIYHTTQDKAAYNGGLFWFTDHYLHARTSTHRTYTRSNAKPGQPYGGGPGAEHNFTSGLSLHHKLTGNPHSREAVLELAQWVVQMDDGRNTILGVVDDGPTGLASAGSGKPGRGPGNSINAVLDAWLLTGDQDWIEAAERLIHRCIHPLDDIDQRQLLDAEQNWSYTVFLTSLARYLDVKLEADQLDEVYAYAQTSLVNYGCWMLVHEIPYFDQRDQLEYPTEAWAVQELRKANVLRHAAVHAEPDLQTSMLDRADQLADRAWQDLLSFETRYCARAMAIVMIEGLWDCWYRNRQLPSVPRLPLPGNLPAPTAFVNQKQRVRQLLNSPAGWYQLASRTASPWRWARWWQRRKRPVQRKSS